jgi:type III pantothenate kinase
MATLLIDIGNTRIKWALAYAGRLSRAHAAVPARWRTADYRRRLFGGARRPQRLVVSSVAGARVARALTAAARQVGAAVTFVKVPRRGGGIRVGYLEPWRLGVDRFVGAVGAHALFAGVPLCVVGVGTALTIDLIDAAGRHHGGAIIPSPALMVDTLLKRTHGIGRRARGGAPGGGALFGRSTRVAIRQGARYAAAAAIDRAVTEATALVGREPLVVLTGGGARDVAPLLASRHVGVPDLVLKGLAVLDAVEQPRSRG